MQILTLVKEINNINVILKIKLIFNYIIIINIFMLLNSCSFFGNSSENLYSTFFVGEDGTQFFIKQLDYYMVENNEKLSLDYTFRYKDKIKDSVTINFTLFTNEFIKNIESFELKSDGKSALSNNAKLLYVDKKDNLCENRFTTKILLDDFLKYCKSNNQKIIIKYNNYSNTYLPENTTIKNIESLNKNLLLLIN